MDITTALAIISQSIGLAKDLQEIDNNLDAASYKAKMAELYTALADVKMALTDAHVELHDKEAEIKELHQAIRKIKSGETCPICEKGDLKVESVIPHPTFGEVGVQQKKLKCNNPDCSHYEERIHDPAGVTGNQFR